METADGSAGSVRNQQLEELLRISLEISSMDLAVLEDPKPGESNLWPKMKIWIW